MNHEFLPNPNDKNKCIECSYPENKHGNNAECDCCNKIGNLEPFLLGNSQALLTRECMEREKALIEVQIEINDNLRASNVQQFGVPANGDERLLQYNSITRPYEKLIGEARKIDEQLHLSSDIFVAKTVPIEDVRKAIWEDENIPQDKKFFEFVAECKRHINHLQITIFDLDKKKIEAYSEQKAWHVAMNDFANKLRVEERQQLKIQDIHYDVKLPKPITPKVIKDTRKNVDKKELRTKVNIMNNELLKLGAKETFNEFTIEMMMMSKHWDIDTAVNHVISTFKNNNPTEPNK